MAVILLIEKGDPFAELFICNKFILHACILSSFDWEETAPCSVPDSAVTMATPTRVCNFGSQEDFIEILIWDPNLASSRFKVALGAFSGRWSLSR